MSNFISEFLDFISTRTINENWPALFIGLPVVLAWKTRDVFEFVVQVRSHREKYLIDALKINYLSGPTRESAIAEIDRIVYFKATRMSRDRYQRETIKLLCDRSDGDLQTDDFRKASKYLSFKKGKFIVALGLAARVGTGANLLLGGMLAVGGFFLFAASIVTPKMTSIQSFELIAAALLYMTLAALMILQSIPYWAAKRIELTLGRLQEDDSVRDNVLHLLSQIGQAKTTDEIKPNTANNTKKNKKDKIVALREVVDSPPKSRSNDDTKSDLMTTDEERENMNDPAVV